MKLQIVEFIRANKNWESRLTADPYNLKIDRFGQYILFMYNMIESNMNEPICNECRGLVLDVEDNYNPVCVPFLKFYNFGEGRQILI